MSEADKDDAQDFPELDEIALLKPIRDEDDQFTVEEPPPVARRSEVPGSVSHLPGSGVAGPARLSPESYTSIDWPWVEELRKLASAELAQGVGGEDDEGAALNQLLNSSSVEARASAQTVVSRLVEEGIADRLRLGTWDASQVDQQALERAVLDALFGMGRLQPFLDDDDIENIDFIGHDGMIIERSNGDLVDGPKIFASEQEMTSTIAFIAGRDGGRAFSPARPNLDLKLQGGERLSATSWVSAKPYMTIRKHRLRDITLHDLVQRQEMTELAAGYLAAMIRAKRSGVVAGQQGAGKTTLVRAMCHEFDPDESIGTFETEFELGLHEMPFFRIVKAFEARPGTGERGIDGRQAGEVTVDDLLYNSFRMNLQRQIVGEVRGREVLTMIKAMQSGSGSLSTTHSANAAGAVRKLITCALEAGADVSLDYATRAISESLHFVVFVSRKDLVVDGVKSRLRYISEICEVSPSGDSSEGFSVTPIFAVTPQSPYVAVPQFQSAFAEELEPTIFNRALFTQQSPYGDRGAA